MPLPELGPWKRPVFAAVIVGVLEISLKLYADANWPDPSTLAADDPRLTLFLDEMLRNGIITQDQHDTRTGFTLTQTPPPGWVFWVQAGVGFVGGLIILWLLWVDVLEAAP